MTEMNNKGMKQKEPENMVIYKPEEELFQRVRICILLRELPELSAEELAAIEESEKKDEKGVESFIPNFSSRCPNAYPVYFFGNVSSRRKLPSLRIATTRHTFTSPRVGTRKRPPRIPPAHPPRRLTPHRNPAVFPV